MNTQKVIISGMHRSGTSLITQWLSQCGLMIGEQLLGKGIGNDDGHFEDLEFYKFHLGVLNSQQQPESGYVLEELAPMTEAQLAIARQLIESRNEKFNQWGWKDPRTCLFLNDYHQLIPDANYLIIIRDFQAIVTSLIKRDYKVIHNNDPVNPNPGFFERIKIARAKKKEIDNLCRTNASFFLKVWIQYSRHLLTLTQQIPAERFRVINYQSLLEKDRFIFNDICKNWNLNLNYIDFRTIFKPSMINESLPLEKFIDPFILAEANDLQKKLMSHLAV